ncbi:hypothetical protein [Paucilactobacillus wasatchensis]|uniref:WxL domain-containing protein n=1 Tax=Paucilactobacillus wasatchensis TaxID=1335616 RepID=A0A0D1A6N1_9LACO|nr:hypothetical protein [Paucilactobacillus wasatchensis]KIS03367.1 hypothetical protein WDC_1059 [Paucilactobacillus wasatchensis]
MRKIRYLLTIVGALVLLIGSFTPLISHAAEETQPTLSLSSNNNTVNVDDAQTITLKTHNLPATSVVTIAIPTGIEVNQDKLNNDLSSDEVEAVVTDNQVELKFSSATDKTINLPVTVTAAGNYQLQAKLAGTEVTSNTLAISGQATDEATAESESQSSASSDSAAVTATTPQTKASLPSTRSDFTVLSDQTSPTGSLTYAYFYNSGKGLTITGTIKSAAKQTLYVGYSVAEVGQTGTEKSLQTIAAAGGSTLQKYSITVPASAFPTFNDTNYGKIFSFRLIFRDTPFGGTTNISRPIILRLVYVKGELAMTAPSEISFGTNLAADFTTKPTIMGSVVSGNALSVIDTRQFGVTLPYKNGWAVTASLGSQMTGVTNKKTLTDSLHYINNGTDYTLGSAAVPVYILANAVLGTTDISKTWNASNGLAFEPQVGQPQAGETYKGVVQWNLQETPGNN